MPRRSGIRREVRCEVQARNELHVAREFEFEFEMARVYRRRIASVRPSVRSTVVHCVARPFEFETAANR